MHNPQAHQHVRHTKIIEYTYFYRKNTNQQTLSVCVRVHVCVCALRENTVRHLNVKQMMRTARPTLTIRPTDSLTDSYTVHARPIQDHIIVLEVAILCLFLAWWGRRKV